MEEEVKLAEYLSMVAKQEVKIECSEAIDRDYFLTYNNEDVAVYGIFTHNEKTYINIIYVNGSNAHTTTSADIETFGLDDKKCIVRYITGIIDFLTKNNC